MKTRLQHSLRPAVVGFAIIAMIGAGLASRAQDLLVDSFDDDQGGTLGLGWANFRDYVYGVTYSFDPGQDSTGNPNSGSMYLTVQWPLHSDPNWNENWNDIQLAFTTLPFNPTNYINFDLDIKVDTTNSSVAISGGDYGAIELIVNNPWTTVVSWAPVAVTGEWQHFHGSFEALPDETNSEAVLGFISTGNDSLTNTVRYWVDNIVFTAVPTVNTNRPVLTLSKAPPAGLTCIASKADGTYQRQMVATANGSYSWNTATATANTTTYAMTVASFPNPNAPGYNAEMFLIPQSGIVPGASIDWYSTNVVALMVSKAPDQSGFGHFQYKVNNGANWNTALVVEKSCATGPVGKWSLAFNNNTNVTLTAPDNSSTNFTIPAIDAAHFQDPLYVYVGAEPNDNANLGLASTFSRVQVSGSAASIDDSFSTLNPATWVKYAEAPAGVFISTADTKYWVSWPAPDAGYTNLFATDDVRKSLGGGQWKALPAADTGWLSVAGSQRLTFVNQSTLNTAFGYAPTNCLFGLFHQ